MNCGDELKGMYCSKCGQYALDINQGFFSYIKQFLENTYQFDGKIMQTVKHLAINPGFLTTEFTKGKINSYVHPMKLYMFMSVLFFSFVFGFFADNSINSSLIAIEDSSSKTENADVDAKKKKALVYIVNESEHKSEAEKQEITAENEDSAAWFK